MTASLAHGRSVDTLDVVLVQDNRGSQAILRSMIASLRVKRLRVYDRADDALSHMMVDPPHVVVTDWEMKPISGYRFIRLIRSKAMEPLCFVPIITVSSNATASLIDRAFSSGANCVLVKPIAPNVLRRRLEWVTADDPGYVLQDDRYVVAGIEEVLEKRVRGNGFNQLLKRQKAMQKALATQAQSAPEAADPKGEGRGPSGGSEPRKPSTWNSWAMN